MKHFALKILIIIFAWSNIVMAANEPIYIQMGGSPATLDPYNAIDQYGFGILRNVMTGLFDLDPDGNLRNGLVKSYTVSKDGLVYRFKLKKEAKWSDGKPVEIEHFVAGLQHVLNPKTASPNAEHFFSIKGAKEVFSSAQPIESLGVAKEGEELVITLADKNPMLPYVLTMSAASPLRKDLWDANKGK